MTGAVMRPAGVATGTVDMSTGQSLSPTYVNSFRISAVTCRLVAHLHGDANTDNTEFCNLCLSLARGIDYAVANNDIPGRASDLPYLLKQVCQRKNDLTSQAAVMVLMISAKSACSNGWFSEKEKEELHGLSDEMQSSFCSVSIKDIKNKESNSHSTISTIMSRFYPGMKMGEIFAVIETTPGYDSYVTDLHISKRSKMSPGEKIYLFVAQTDNLETSSCIISPQQVNFLLNGEGVDRRTCVHKDPGPQMPTPVTQMLKYGSNLLQVVGQFNGKYIIAIAFMSFVSNPSFPTIPDYIPPVTALADPDNDIIEGPSRISLKCPISFSRIKIPVKGHTCKHLQCFDFNNYVNINSRRPQWRCPHCSQSVCFHDIRIDQSMVKVLKEVGEDISYVKISADGSWEAVENNEHTEKPNDATPSQQENNIQKVDDIMDLTGNDTETDKTSTDEDVKPSPAGEPSVPSKNIAPHMEDGFWREFYSSGTANRMTNTTPNVNEIVQRNNLIYNSLPQSQNQNQNQSQLPVSNNLQALQQQYDNMRYQTWVTRANNAIQALPAQNSARVADGDRQQQNFSRSHLNQTQGQHHSHFSNQTSPQIGARSVQINGGRHTSPLPESRFNSHQHQHQQHHQYQQQQQQQIMNQRTPLPVRPSGQPTPQGRLGGAHGGLTPQYSMAALHRATSQVRIQTPGSSVPVASTGEQRVDVSGAGENWRPAGRMRGSITGRENTETLNIIHPNQPTQAARPPPVLNIPRPFIPPHLQALMANNLRDQTPQPGATGPSSDGAAAGVSPNN